MRRAQIFAWALYSALFCFILTWPCVVFGCCMVVWNCTELLIDENKKAAE